MRFPGLYHIKHKGFRDYRLVNLTGTLLFIVENYDSRAFSRHYIKPGGILKESFFNVGFADAGYTDQPDLHSYWVGKRFGSAIGLVEDLKQELER